MTALAWGAIVYFTRATLDQPAYRSSIVIPPDIRVSGPPSQRFALSPDGRFLALAAVAEDGEARLWVHSFESASVRPLSGTEGGTAPFWSPDGRFLGFFANDKLKKIDLAGGPPVTLADVDGAAGASWSTNDVILFASSRSALRTVPASGGNPALVTSLDAGNGEVTHVSPAFLPDGRHFLFHAAGSKEGGSFDPNGIYVGVIGSWERKLLVGEGSNAQYAAGYLLFLRQRALMAQSFDVELLELTKDPIVVAEQIAAGPFLHTGAFSVSTTGALAYQTNQPQPPSQLVWFDRTGKRLGALGEPAFYRHPELSPDGTQVAIAILDPITNTNDLWLIDVARGVRTRFTVAHTEERFPTWSSDGNRVAFTSGRGGRFDVFVQTSNGSRGEERLTHDLENKYPTSWSPDGRTILFYTGGSTQGSGNDLWILPLFGDRKPLQFLQTPFNELEGRFSPDGRWIAYQSTESGRMEVYAAAVSDPGRKSRVSAGGGTHPRWARAGREILYLAPDGKLMAAGVQLGEATIEIGSPKPMFQTRLAHPSWTLSSDGEKFLLNTMLEETADAPIMLFLNWSAALSRLGSPAP
jgi:Tol biopolymer transport system component